MQVVSFPGTMTAWVLVRRPDMHPWIGISDTVRLGLLTERIVPELMDEVLTTCGRRDAKPRPLSSRFMVSFVLALALFQQDSYDDVAENLVGALGEMDQAVPNKSSFTRARQQLGAAPLEGVFRSVRGAIAPPALEAAFWHGIRVAAVDGFLLDVPENHTTRAAFGGQVDSAGRPIGFPQARVVTLTETGAHATIDARIGSFKGGGGEPALATEMAGSAAGMLVITDRAFPGIALWKAYEAVSQPIMERAGRTGFPPG
ncbi:transposase domain-containing protein [Streptomyces sp. NPDC005708]|uniref:transposase domain-containing protein n=1 Tax=Streptomyces sp. NPDC005708 TaxID=3154564 RepID=UPI0033EF52D9